MSTVDRLMHDGLRDGVFPSAVLLVASRGEPVLHRAWGEAQLDTIYDVASLTKAVCTSVVAMRLHDRGLLPLDARTRLLLAHAAGLPAHRPYYRRLRGRAVIARAAEREPWVYPPGTRSLYSDVGFIALGAVIERAGGSRLDRLFRCEVAVPLGLPDTRFGPFLSRGSRVAPTAPRRRGVVDDANARAMGGVAGHAGLFSTAADLHLVCRALAGAWQDEGGLVSRATIRRFWRRELPRTGSTWCLGWDTPSPRGSQAGTLLSRRTVGHLGFTGCSLWIDPVRELWIVLLTNRVRLGREPNLLKRFRPRLHDAILRALP